MSANFLDHIKAIEDGRIPGMTTYPLDEVLLTVLVGLLCRMEDFDEIAMFGEEQLDWLRCILPFANGVAPAQTLRRALRALDPKALAAAFASWVASCRPSLSPIRASWRLMARPCAVRSRTRAAPGLCMSSRPMRMKPGLSWRRGRLRARAMRSPPFPELLDLLTIEGAIVTIDAMGTQKAIAAKIIDQERPTNVLAVEGKPRLAPHADVAAFFADPALAKTCASGGVRRRRSRPRRGAHGSEPPTPTWLAETSSAMEGDLQSIAALT